jgi:hypothetical protein
MAEPRRFPGAATVSVVEPFSTVLHRSMESKVTTPCGQAG